MSSKHKKSRSRSRPQNAPLIPNAYPTVPGYPIPAQQWLPPQPTANYPYHWYQPWGSTSSALNTPNVSWLPRSSSVASAPGMPVSSPKSSIQPDEFTTVDSLRRIYNNDEGSIEIERVKVQRRQGIYDTKQNTIEYPSESRSLVPCSSVRLNERRPPPRKNKRRDVTTELVKKQDVVPPQGWYPYMPYMPQPFIYPYPYGYVWPMPPPPSSMTMSPECHSLTDDSDSSVSRQETFPMSSATLDLSQGKSRSPEIQRPPSSATGSHVTESLGTDLAPSDSVSMRGFKRETSFERVMRTSLPKSKYFETMPSDSLTSEDVEKTREWMEDMQKAFETKSGIQSDAAGDRSSFATAPSDIPTPPMRKKQTSSKLNLTHRKSNSESNIDNHEEERSATSLPLLESTRVSDSDLVYALNKLDRATDGGSFRSHSPSNLTRTRRYGDENSKRLVSGEGGRDSRTSSMSFHSTRQSTEEILVDTDSTDIAIPNDSSTADESVENFEEEEEEMRRKNYKWVLQHGGDADSSDFIQRDGKHPTSNELIENWKTEVSLWRARLVVSLCRGQGFDQQDWGTFHLLVQHPLPIDLKLSLLHAHRLCSQNYDVGVAMLRNGLLHLTAFGEALMKPESERPSGWKTIVIDPSQPWVPVKGSVEILRVFGYRVKGGGTLKYKKKHSPEVSVIARLTLDLLALAEEFRLFLTGSHQYPINITQLFTPQDPYSKDQRPRYNDSLSTDEDDRNALKRDSGAPIVAEQHQDSWKRDYSEVKQRVSSPQASDTQSNVCNVSLEEGSHLSPSHEKASSDSTSLSAMDSLPDLRSPSQASGLKLEGSDKELGSRETLTPTPIPQLPDEIISEKTFEKENVCDSITEDRKTEAQSDKTKGSKDNPEDHVYEEIGDIKSQVEALRKGEYVSQSPPPPLPPKTNISQHQDFYPHVDWSISSQYSSVHGGSTGRRKKRRAPIPPELFEKGDKETDSLPESIKDMEVQFPGPNKEREIQFPIPNKEPEGQSPMPNLLVNETGSVNKSSGGNPFYEETPKPAGYVGKNPFYEVVPKKLENGQPHYSVSHHKDKGPNMAKSDAKADQLTINISPAATSEDVSEVSSSCSGLPAGVRPQRRKGKTTRAPLAPSVEKTCQNDISVSADDKSSENDSLASVETLKPISKDPIETKTQTKTVAVAYTKNEGRELQCGPQVAVPPNRETITEGKLGKVTKEPDKKSVIFQKISITYDISLDPATCSTSDSQVSKAKPIQDSEVDFRKHLVKNVIEKPSLSADAVCSIKEGLERIPKEAKLKGDLETSATVTNAQMSVGKKNKDDPPTGVIHDSMPLGERTDTVELPTTDDHHQIPSDEKAKPVELPKPVAKTGNTESKVKLPETAADNRELTGVRNIEVNLVEPQGNEMPPTPPPKAALRLIDDIPYIDTNDVKRYKSNYGFTNRQQQPHYGLSQIYPQEAGYFPLLNVEGKTSTFLKRSSLVPFIDESDIPPGSPPSPPPLPPPSPPLTLLSSAPFTFSPMPLSPQAQATFVQSPRANTESRKMLEESTGPLEATSVPTNTPECQTDGLSKPTVNNDPKSASEPRDPVGLRDTDFEGKSPVPFVSLNQTLCITTDSGIVGGMSNTSVPQPEIETSVPFNSGIMNPGSAIVERVSTAPVDIVSPEIVANTSSSGCPLSSLRISLENSDPERKSQVLFRRSSEKESIVTSSEKEDPEKHGYEIPEPMTLVEPHSPDAEERYDIPDVARAIAFHLASTEVKVSDKKKKDSKTDEEDSESGSPKRPPRHLIALKTPPPRPPKKQSDTEAPALPPKSSSKPLKPFSDSSANHGSSLPSTLVKPSSKGFTKVPPSPLAIPAMYTSTGGGAQKALSLSSIPTNPDVLISNNPGTPATEKELTNGQNDSNTCPQPTSSPAKKFMIVKPSGRPIASSSSAESLSTPSSPRPILKDSVKLAKKNKNRQRSWPSLLCDCVYPSAKRTSEDDFKNVAK